MDLAKPPDRDVEVWRDQDTEGSKDREIEASKDREIEVLKDREIEGLGEKVKAGEDRVESRDSKKASWVEVVQEKNVLRKYELEITDSEGRKSVEIPDEVINNVNPLWEDYLIGKFLDTAPHIARIHAVVNKIWSYGDRKQLIDVQVIDGTTLKFQILNPMVRAKVLRKGMWNIGNVPMVITKWIPNELEEKPEVK